MDAQELKQEECIYVKTCSNLSNFKIQVLQIKCLMGVKEYKLYQKRVGASLDDCTHGVFRKFMHLGYM